MRKKLLTFTLALCTLSLPLMAVVNGRTLTKTLRDLSTELLEACQNRDESQKRFEADYERQHQRLIDVIKESNEFSILLYTQEQGRTFDLAYALKKVTTEYWDFSQERSPYDQIVSSLNLEIDRYARLIEALRRLPPMKKEIEEGILPDSLVYRNDSLDVHLSDSASALEQEIIRIAVRDTVVTPFILDAEGETYRDSCIQDASELLKMHADNRDAVIADSSHYQEAFWRMEEAYTYAEARYDDLERYVFSEGQVPFKEILKNCNYYWNKTKADLDGQYNFDELKLLEESEPADSLSEEAKEAARIAFFDRLSSRGIKSVLVVGCIVQIVTLALTWLITFILLWLIARYVKTIRSFIGKKFPLFAVLTGTILYFMFFGYLWKGGEYMQMGVHHINTFLWLLIAISGSLLLRVKPEQIRHGIQLYSSAVFAALVIIVCRITFIPDRVMMILFPPILFVVVLCQLFVSFRVHGKAPHIDSTLGWVSLAIYLIAFGFAFMGYTFVALLVLVWWYFQLALLLSIVCLSDLLSRYKRGWLDKRIKATREGITYVKGDDRESLLFSVTWFYDLLRQVVIPVLVVFSLPFCLHLSLNVFDFNDLYMRLFDNPFVQFIDKDGYEVMCISFKSIVFLLVLFYVLRYVNRALHAIWQYLRYKAFMSKYNRTSIRPNEINHSLANSIITIIVWMSYAVVIVAVWKIPTGSLSMVAGGLSAGIDLVLKDTINNFIYGIQLMGGRLRVGDWIECDGVRGQVVAINYQCVQVETLEGTEMSFLNASLFGKNFNNLTRNNSYEFTKIIVGVAYGTDVKVVCEVLVKALQQVCTKDHYGRDIVDPKYGIYVVVEDMGDSAVNIAVKQYVLVAERIGYIDRAKEMIYDALNAAGISIPFPQCDVHLIHDDAAAK